MTDPFSTGAVSSVFASEAAFASAGVFFGALGGAFTGILAFDRCDSGGGAFSGRDPRDRDFAGSADAVVWRFMVARRHLSQRRKMVCCYIGSWSTNLMSRTQSHSLLVTPNDTTTYDLLLCGGAAHALEVQLGMLDVDEGGAHVARPRRGRAPGRGGRPAGGRASDFDACFPAPACDVDGSEEGGGRAQTKKVARARRGRWHPRPLPPPALTLPCSPCGPG